MMKKTTKIQPQRKAEPSRNKTQPFIDHVRELRRRLFYVVGFVVIFGSIGAIIREQLISILLKPASNQHFIYTTPGGGFDFNFRICLYFGLACGVPVLVYNVFRYIAPLLKQNSNRFFVKTTLFSCLLAATGVAFGYFISLPSAMKFLLNQFGNDQISALLTISEYMSFVMLYLVGFALLFQIPLVLLFINRITPLKPSKLMKSQRWVFAISFIAAAILTPTADIMNMTIMAAPIILMFQFGVLLVWIVNRYNKVDTIERLRHEDEQKQQARETQRLHQKPLVMPAPAPLQQQAQPQLAFAQPQLRSLKVQRFLVQ